MQKPDQLALLRDLLSTRFDDGELRDLCADLRVDYQNLPGETKKDKARELVAYMERRGWLDDLIAQGRQSRPDIPWPEWSAGSPEDPSDKDPSTSPPAPGPSVQPALPGGDTSLTPAAPVVTPWPAGRARPTGATVGCTVRDVSPPGGPGAAPASETAARMDAEPVAAPVVPDTPASRRRLQPLLLRVALATLLLAAFGWLSWPRIQMLLAPAPGPQARQAPLPGPAASSPPSAPVQTPSPAASAPAAATPRANPGANLTAAPAGAAGRDTLAAEAGPGQAPALPPTLAESPPAGQTPGAPPAAAAGTSEAQAGGAGPGSRLFAVQVGSWSEFRDVKQLAWLPGSSRIALGGYGVSLYDPKTAGAQKLVDRGWSPGLDVVASWPGGSGPGIATFDDAGGVVYDPLGAELMKYPSLKNARCLAVSPDGRRLAACFNAGVRVFDAQTGQETATLAAGQSSSRAAFSPDGKWLAVAGSDVKLFDPQGKAAPANGPDPGSGVDGLAFSPDGNLLATAGQGGLRLWDVPGRRSLGSLADGPVTAPAFSADGRLLAAAAAPALIKVWDVATRQEVAAITGHTGMPAALAFAGDCASYVDGPGSCLALLASGASDGFRLWRLANAAATRPAYATGIPPTRLPITQGGITAANAGSLQTVATWDKDEAQELAWAPDGASLVIAAYHLYRYTPEGAATDLLSDQQWSDALSVGSGSDGALRILISQGDGVGLLDGNGGQVALYPGLRSAGGTALSADGSLVAVGIGSVVKLLEAASGRELATLQGPPGGVRPVALSGDGKWLAAGATRIALWNLTEALAGKDQPLTTLDPGNGVYTLAFAPDGQTLASAGEAGVRVWRVPGGNLYRRLQETATHALGWSPDGRLIASSTQPALVKIWDVAGGQEVASLAGHATQPNSVAFSPDGTRLASCGSSSESSVRLWGLP